MGFRNYIGRISKDEYRKIKDLSKEELFKIKNENPEDGLIGIDTLIDETLYELGKRVDDFGFKFLKPFFTNNELQDEYSIDEEFYIGDINFFKSLINMYDEKIKSYYGELLKPFCKNDNKRWLDCDFIKTVVRGFDDETCSDTFTFDLEKITKEQQTGIINILHHVRSISLEWDNNPYNLEKGEEITTSWKYEYSLFELVRLFKIFNWEKDLLIYYGH